MVIINKLYLSEQEKASVFPLAFYKTKIQVLVTYERSLNAPLPVATVHNLYPSQTKNAASSALLIARVAMD